MGLRTIRFKQQGAFVTFDGLFELALGIIGNPEIVMGLDMVGFKF